MKEINYPNWLVPLEIAEKLKGINFNLECYFYREEGRNGDDLIKSPFSLSNEVLRNYNKSRYDTSTSLPTWEQAFEWFRGKGLFHSICFTDDLPHEVKFFEAEIRDKNADIICIINRLTYEEVREAVLNKLIEIYENNI